MKLIALRHFRNPQRQLEIEGHQHPDHVHKGAIFVFGDKPETTQKQLRKSELELLQNLAAAEAVGDANDEKLVARIKAEAAEEKKTEERIAAQMKPAAEKEPAKEPKK